MKLTKWSFAGLEVPMMEDEDGELYCTSKALCGALGVTEGNIRSFYNDNKAEFDSLTVSNRHAKEFFREHQSVFELKRIRGNIRIWSEDDMLVFAFFLKTPQAREFRRELRLFIKQQARKDTVSREEFMSLLERVKNMELEREEALPRFNLAASCAGKTLASFRGTTDFRKIH